MHTTYMRTHARWTMVSKTMRCFRARSNSAEHFYRKPSGARRLSSGRCTLHMVSCNSDLGFTWELFSFGTSANKALVLARGFCQLLLTHVVKRAQAKDQARNSSVFSSAATAMLIAWGNSSAKAENLVRLTISKRHWTSSKKKHSVERQQNIFG